MTHLENTTIDIHPLIARRKSAVAFSDKPVEPHKLLSLLEAARWAPSSRNEQPWRFLIVTQAEPELFAAFLNCMSEPNRQWAQHAYALICAVAQKESTITGSFNRYAWHDLGLAVSNLLLQATSLGLNTHLIGGFSAEEARRVMQIPDGYEAVEMITIGYPSEVAQLPPVLLAKENRVRKRMPIQEIAFAGTWHAPLAEKL
jgi:nitroreductase